MSLNSDAAPYRATVDDAICRRCTVKVLSDTPIWPGAEQRAQVRAADEQIEESIALAGWAPFHYDRRVDGVAEPWRMYVLLHESCRALGRDFEKITADMKPGNKIPKMLNACGALVLVTWIPEESLEDNAKLEAVNSEHLAATAAAVQNLLLALETRGLGTYWSSGGSLGSLEMFQRLGISTLETLLAAVFVDYPVLSQRADVERITGKNREKRSPASRWSQRIDYSS